MRTYEYSPNNLVTHINNSKKKKNHYKQNNL